MKKAMKRFSLLLLTSALVGTMATVPAFADEISSEPIQGIAEN